jgi:hypothetical protein
MKFFKTLPASEPIQYFFTWQGGRLFTKNSPVGRVQPQAKISDHAMVHGFVVNVSHELQEIGL